MYLRVAMQIHKKNLLQVKKLSLLIKRNACIKEYALKIGI